MVRYLFYTIGDLTYQSPLVELSVLMFVYEAFSEVEFTEFETI